MFKEFGFTNGINESVRSLGDAEAADRGPKRGARALAELDKSFFSKSEDRDRPGGAAPDIKTRDALREYKIDECAAIAARHFTPDVIERWQYLGVRERMGRYDAFRRDLAKELGIRSEGIRWYDPSVNPAEGYVKLSGDHIYLNRRLAEDKNMLINGVNTVAHESRHLFQIQFMTGKPRTNGGADVTTAWREAVAMYPGVLDGASAAGRYDPWGYANNALELDARHFADSVVLRIPREPR